MDRTSWKPKIFKATEAVDYKANENLEDLEISGSDFSITHGGTVVSCNSCSKTWFVGQYPRSNVNNTEREINSHGDAHAPLDSLFNISGKSGSSDGSCKQCGAIPDNEDYVGHLKQHGTDYIGEAKASEEYSALYSGKCKRCGQRKEVTNVSGTWTNAISDQEYPDGNIPSPTCLDCYYDIYGEPDGDPDYGFESKANEDDHKKSWDKLDSIAKQGFSDIGYDQQSWDSEPEEVRAEMETVVKDNMSQENWKEVANKIYKEELNKGKKSGGEGLIPYQELLNHTRVDKEGDFVLCNYCNQTYDLGEMDELIDNNTITKHLHGHGIRSPVVTAYDVLKDTESKASEFNYNVLIKGKPSKEKLRDEFAPYVNIEDDGENTRVIFDGLVDGGKQELESLGYDVIGESKVKRYKVGDNYYDDLDDAKRMSDVTGYAVFDNDNWGKMIYDGESYSNEADPCWKGYKQIGMKDKNGKQVPNCVPNSSGNEYSLPSMFKKKKSNFHNTSFKDYAKVFEEPIESKWERKKHVLGGDFYDFFKLEWNSVPSEIQDIFRATVSVESKADEFTDWGSWAEDETGVGSKMSQHDQIAMMKDLGIADKTLRNMGYNLQKDGVEGFIDRIEKELSKFGINLDKPEEQEQED